MDRAEEGAQPAAGDDEKKGASKASKKPEQTEKSEKKEAKAQRA
jgi:hypothetical protein